MKAGLQTVHMKVLIADNVKLFQQLVSSLFQNTGLEPVVTGSASECLELLEQEHYEFICISMHLQDMSGIDLCKSIRSSKEHAFTPVILFTSEYSPRLLSQALAAGVTEIFNKARDLDQLVAYIKRFSLQHLPLQGGVLYVEDSRSLRMNTEQILLERGLEVDSFDSAEAAWEAFQKKKYDLVITDIVLAGRMSGLAFVNKIRRLNDRRGDTPILAVTGFDDIARRIELFQLGINDYAIKPLIQAELLARVRYLLGTSIAIERQLKLIRRIFDYSPNPILIIDTNGCVEQSNDAFSNMTGVSADRLHGRSVFDFCVTSAEHECQPEKVMAALNDNGHFDGDFMLKGALDQLIPCFVTLDRLEDNASVISQYMCILRKK